ncbi:MAG TPA: alanine dehydrogenase [Halanaerobiales bacterium]|nr:alanine dehydrogenase [Halanaerobiales bacterium]
MIIGVPAEIKNNENRVGITAAGVSALTDAGHQVLVQKGAGNGSGISDKNYLSEGAEIVNNAEEIYTQAEMIIKVKEPLPAEYNYLKKGQVLFTYLHLAAEQKLTNILLEKEVVAIAYETVQPEDGSLPLLTPMSEVAGRLSIQTGAYFLEKPQGGSGVLLGGVPGVKPAKVVVLGGGSVGINAARMAVGLGAEVTILDISTPRLRYLDDIFNSRAKTLISNKYNIAEETAEADLVIGAVLIPGGRTPALINKEMVKNMKNGSVIVDVAIDQGGCVETTYPTTHDNPVFTKHGVIHYSVSNMPGAVARTSSFALSNATFPYVLELANKGYINAMKENKALAAGLNICSGKITCPAVAEAFEMKYTPVEEIKLS